MNYDLTPEDMGILFEAINNEPSNKLSEIARVARLDLTNDYVGADLSNEDLSNDNLTNINLSFANLENTNFSNSILVNANFSGANLNNTCFTNANLEGAIFKDCDLSSTILHRVIRSQNTSLRPSKTIPYLKEFYLSKSVPYLIEEFNYSNIHQVPKVTKITINRGIGEASKNAKALESSKAEFATITGQKPIVTRAKKAIAAFEIRRGMPVGVMLTLRAERMYNFLDRLINLALPRIRDFRGISPNSFDGRGNYSLGIREQVIFPEIDYASIGQIRGMDISIITSAQSDEEGRALLKSLGMPFRST